MSPPPRQTDTALPPPAKPRTLPASLSTEPSLAVPAAASPTLRIRAAVLMPVIALAVVALGAWLGDTLRHDLIEPVERATACAAVPVPWWCPVRDGVRIAAQNYVIAGLAVATALAALALRGRGAYLALVAALLLGGAGLYLYSTALASIAVVLGLLRAAACHR